MKSKTFFEKKSYIKTFENLDKYVYWLIRTDTPYYEISLKKIGMNDSDFEGFSKNRILKRNSKVYISYDSTESFWGWVYEKYSDYYKEKGARYMGEVTVEDWEIEDYYMKKDAKKYNM